MESAAENGGKAAAEAGIQTAGSAGGRGWEAAAAAGLRAACLASSVLAVSLMVTADQRGTLVLFGILELPLYSKWSYADSLVYLVGVSTAAAAYSLVQLLLSAGKMLNGMPVVASRSHAWIIFAGDQAFAYAMMSAGSAAAGVTNVNRTGIRHTPFPDFCEAMHQFCFRMAVSIALAFLSCLFLGTSAVLNVIWLSQH